MSRYFRVSAISFVLIATLSSVLGCSTAPRKAEIIPRGNYEYTKEYVTWLTKREMKKHDVVGLSIALVDNQDIIWARGFGYSDKANEIAATAETVYRIGSISKLFTVMAAMQLAEQGKIDLDLPLQMYLPQFSVKTRFITNQPITPRAIMTHHSGLPSDFFKGNWTGESFTEVVQHLKEEYTAYPPNHVFSYSNAAMTLLGHMVQEVSGTPYDEYMEHKLLKPIGMKKSFFKLNPEISAMISKGYAKGKKTDPMPIRDLPAGGMYSTVVDLGKFIQMVLAKGKVGTHEVLHSETIAEILSPQNGDVPLDFDFSIGLGWMLSGVDIEGSNTAAWHSGRTLLFVSQYDLRYK